MDTEQEFFMVWSPMGGPPTKRHPSKTQARKEAERLAVSNPGQEFYILRAFESVAIKKTRTVLESKDKPAALKCQCAGCAPDPDDF